MTGATSRPRKPIVWRSVLFQTALLAAMALLLYQPLSNLYENITRLSLYSGFDFLNRTSGFSIIQTLISYSEQSTFGRVFVVGLLNTLLVAVLGIVLASALGFLIGIARLSRNWMVRTLARSYVEIMRNIPLLLHLFFWYFIMVGTLPRPRQSLELGAHIFLNNRGLYLPVIAFETGANLMWLALGAGLVVAWGLKRWPGVAWPKSILAGLCMAIGMGVAAYGIGLVRIAADLPVLQGFNFSGGVKVIPEFSALLIALSLYTAAYIAEIVRAGIIAVPDGQREAARALGLNSRQTLRLVVIPLALRVIVPPLTSQYLNLTKNSSLAVAIGYPDLVSVFMGTTLNQTGLHIEIVLITLSVYLALSLITSAGMNWFNARVTHKRPQSHD